MRHCSLRMFAVFVVVLALTGCGFFSRTALKPSRPGQKPAVVRSAAKQLSRMGYTIQAGAFSQVKNAVRLTESLRKEGLDAYYFRHQTEVYKVRLGDFRTEKEARQRAESLKSGGVIEAYYIVSPREYAAAREQEYGTDYIRENLVETAENFLGLPYLWGGTGPEDGFDCSGLTMAVYRHNGLVLPRSSREQSEAGAPVDFDQLRKGDLVFFAIKDGKKVSHVGIYTGDGRFIHAPGRGKVICAESMRSGYFSQRYAGARTYLSVSGPGD